MRAHDNHAQGNEQLALAFARYVGRWAGLYGASPDAIAVAQGVAERVSLAMSHGHVCVPLGELGGDAAGIRALLVASGVVSGPQAASNCPLILDADDVRVIATGNVTSNTTALAGTDSPGSFPGAVALTATSNDTIARVRPGTDPSTISGDLVVHATHDATTSSTTAITHMAVPNRANTNPINRSARLLRRRSRWSD